MLLLLLLLANVLALAAMGFDKFQARAGSRRVPERTLLAIAALGGSPGMALGAALFRHKTRKQPFRRYLAGIAVVQIFVLAAGAGALLLETRP